MLVRESVLIRNGLAVYRSAVVRGAKAAAVGEGRLREPDGADPSALEDTCSIAATLELIGDRWTLLILRDAFRGIRRFEALHRDLGIARNLLADRLARLVEHGVLEKVRYQDRPPRSEYRLTEAGRELSPVLVALMHWGDRHTAPPAGPPVELVHRACGHPIEVRMTCPACELSVSATGLVGRPGPGLAAAPTVADSSTSPTSGTPAPPIRGDDRT